MGLRGEGAELPWIRITAKEKQAAGLGVVPAQFAVCGSMGAENVGCK